MNWLIIILAIILIVLVWYIYTIYSSAPTVASNIDLSTTALTITGDQIAGGTSTTYSIGCWIFVKNANGITGKNGETNVDIFNYVVDSSAPTKTNLFSLNIDRSSGLTLNAKIATGTGTTTQNIVLSSNLPVQTWVYVTVSVSATYIDSYINGKLVKSTPISNIYQPSNYPANNKSGPTFISNTCPVIITGLSRWNTPLDPQTIWNYYSQGNGNAMQQMLGSNYHLNLVLKKDSKIHDLSIF
jgi:hypothetical protein